jgi:hypothetical protein
MGFALWEILSGGLGGEAPPITEEEAKADDETKDLAKPPLLHRLVGFAI